MPRQGNGRADAHHSTRAGVAASLTPREGLPFLRPFGDGTRPPVSDRQCCLRALRRVVVHALWHTRTCEPTVILKRYENQYYRHCHKVWFLRGRIVATGPPSLGPARPPRECAESTVGRVLEGFQSNFIYFF